MFGLFKRKKSKQDEAKDAMVAIFRPMLPEHSKMTDKQILQAIHTTMTAFKKAAEAKGDDISADSLIKISAKFVLVYDMVGSEFFQEHLNYEINKYLSSGLRPDYI